MIHPIANPFGLCARYQIRRRDMVRQDRHRVESHPYGEASALRAWAWSERLLTLGEPMLKNIKGQE